MSEKKQVLAKQEGLIHSKEFWLVMLCLCIFYALVVFGAHDFLKSLRIFGG